MCLKMFKLWTDYILTVGELNCCGFSDKHVKFYVEFNACIMLFTVFQTKTSFKNMWVLRCDNYILSNIIWTFWTITGKIQRWQLQWVKMDHFHGFIFWQVSENELNAMFFKFVQFYMSEYDTCSVLNLGDESPSCHWFWSWMMSHQVSLPLVMSSESSTILTICHSSAIKILWVIYMHCYGWKGVINHGILCEHLSLWIRVQCYGCLEKCYKS